jgi:F0F1-type ATP synthase epsilon subunit
MLSASRIIARRLHSSALRAAEAAPAAASGKLAELTLNFAVPDRALVNKKEVKRVTVPGRDGALGLERNSPALLTEMRPGVIRVDFMDNSSEEFFVPGGFAFKHANNQMDISAPEGVKLEHIDLDALRAANADAIKKREAATAGSKEQAEAKITLDLYRILAQTLKVQL